MGCIVRLMSRSAARLCAAAPHWESRVQLDELVTFGDRRVMHCNVLRMPVILVLVLMLMRHQLNQREGCGR